MRNRTQFRRHAVPPEPGIQPTRQARRFITIHHISSQFRIHAGRRTGAPRNSAPSLEFKTKAIPIFGHYSCWAPYLHKPEYEFKTKPNSPESGFRFTIEGQCTASFCSP